MAISNSIDGSSNSAASQIFDLLSIMADPKAYNEKLKALQEAIEKNQKFVELVGPAKDIVNLHEKAKQEYLDAKAAAQAVIEQSKAEAEATKSEAAVILDDARKQAAEVKKSAQKLEYEAQVKNNDLAGRIIVVQNEKALLEAARWNAETISANADEQIKAAEAARAAANADRDAIIAKHKAFIESLA